MGKVEPAQPTTWWSHQSSRARFIYTMAAGFVALVTLLQAFGGYGTALLGWWQGRQPGHDERILNGLRTGVQSAVFEAALGVPQTATLAEGIRAGRFTLQDRLFILSQVYVEEFVDQSGAVAAYTITARDSPLPQGVQVLGGTVDFGSTPIGSDGSTLNEWGMRIAYVCGAHIGAYFEVTDGLGVSNFRSVAVGSSTAGFSAQLGQFCEHWPIGLKEIRSANPLPDSYVIDEYEVPKTIPSWLAKARAATPINTVSVTAADVPLVPAMISLHPQELSQLDPNRPLD